MGEHAKFSPSKLNEISLCPGMPNAIAALPPDERDTKSEAADTGTRRHALLEWKAYHPTEPWPTQVWEYKITSEDVRLVQEVWKYLEKHPARGLGQGNLFLTETEVQIGAYLKLPVEDLWGTVDCVLVTADTVEIADAKFGNWQVEPDSWQLKAYAIGVIGDHLVDKATGQFHPQHRQIRNLRLTIMQPTGGGETIRSVEFPLTAVEVWMKEIKEIVLEAKDPEAPRVPGDKQCKFCPAASTCPARSALVQSEMEGAFEVLGDEPGSDRTHPRHGAPGHRLVCRRPQAGHEDGRGRAGCSWVEAHRRQAVAGVDQVRGGAARRVQEHGSLEAGLLHPQAVKPEPGRAGRGYRGVEEAPREAVRAVALEGGQADLGPRQ